MSNQTLINKATELKKELDNQRPLPQEVVNDLKNDFYIKNTYHSNAIEGNTLTLYETKAVLEDGVTIAGKSFREHAEVNNHKEAIQYIEEFISEGVSLNQRMVKDIHAIVLQGINRKIARKYRSVPALITGVTHTPPSPEKIQEEMDKLFRWYEESHELHPIEKVALLHAKFVNIHPFADGNGRTARLLMNYELMKNKYPPLTIETEDRFKYYEVLDISGSSGNYEPFIEFIAEREVKALERYIAFLNGRKLEPRKDNSIDKDDFDRQ